MNKKGFTLVELLAVVVIIAILASLAVPNIISMTTRAKNEQFITDAKQIIAKAKYYYKNNPTTDPIALQTLRNQGLELENSPFGGKYKDDSKVTIIAGCEGLEVKIYLTDGEYCINSKSEEELKDSVQKCS